MARWRVVAVVAVVAGYALLSHALMVHATAAPWTVAALFGPLLAALALGGWKRRHLPTLAFCVALTGAIALVVARGGVDVNRLYVLQHAAFHLALAAMFGWTLRPGSTALITVMAERVHEQFTPPMRAYTRTLTAVWVGYFLAMTAISLAIYALAPWEWWSLFANVATPLAAAAFFVGEHVFRYVLHPEFERVTLARVARAWRTLGATGVR